MRPELCALLTRLAQCGMRKSLKTGRVNLLAATVTDRIGAVLHLVQGTLYLGQRVAQSLSQGQVPGLLKDGAGIIGHVRAVARALTFSDSRLQLAQLALHPLSLGLQPYEVAFHALFVEHRVAPMTVNCCDCTPFLQRQQTISATWQNARRGKSAQ